MDELGAIFQLLEKYGPGLAFGAVFLWLYLQERKISAALTARIADTGDKMAAAMEKTAGTIEGLREVVRAATPR